MIFLNVAEPEPATSTVNNTSVVHDSSRWSVIPFKENTEIPVVQSTSYISKESSLTWWTDPENPSERIALDDL